MLRIIESLELGVAGRVSGHSLRSAPLSRSQQPAPALSNCRKRAISRRPPCRRTTHGHQLAARGAVAKLRYQVGA